MNKRTHFLGIGLLGFAILSAVLTPQTVQAAPNCLPAPNLSASADASWTPKTGVSVKIWNFARGVSHSGPEATRVSVAQTTLDNFDVVPMHEGFPNYSDPYAMMRNYNAYAAINTDFFDLSWPTFAWGAIVREGVPEYLPLVFEDPAWRTGWLKVVGTIDDLPQTTNGYLTNGFLTTPWDEIPLRGINLKSIPANTAIAYDPKFSGNTPKGAATVVIKGGEVIEVYPQGKSLAVPVGAKIIQATGTVALLLRALSVKPTAKVQINGPTTKGFSTRGFLSSSAIDIPVVGVNLPNLKAGATVFNQNWKQSKTPKGALTWTVSEDKVLKVFKSGATSKPAANTYVVQFLKPSKATLKIKPGTLVDLTHTIPSTTNGYRTNGAVTAAAGKLPIAGINLALVNDSGVLVFDDNWNSQTPQGAVTITVSNGTVVEVDLDGNANIPSAGQHVIQVPESLREIASRFSTKTAAAVSLDPPTERVRVLTSTHIISSSTITVGSDVVPIGAVNFRKIASTAGTIYNQHWLGTDHNRLTPASKATVVIRDGKVAAVYPLGASVNASATDTVIQLPRQFRTIVSAWSIGADALIDLKVTTKNNKQIINAFGRGRPNLTNSEIVTACNPNDDGVRPRTSIGWDKFGRVWLITGSPTGSGLSNDGYRDGGATVHQMAEWLLQLGATEAVSFDGGGSTWMMRGGSGGVNRVDMANPGQNDDPWIRWVPISLGIVDRNN